jgi:O-antigen/teichoic acid export membrane protein
VRSGRPDTITELLRSFWWRVAAAAAGMGSTFALTVIAVRTLDHEEAAGFFAILAALGIGPSIGRLGLGPNVIRLIPAEPDREQRRVIAGTHLRVTALLTLSTAPIVAAVATAGLIGHGNFLAAFLLTSAIIVIETLRMMLSDIFAAVGRVPASVATTHYIRSTMVLPVVGLVAITLQRPTLTILLGAYVAVAAVQFAIALWFARRDVAVFRSAGVASLREAIGKGTRLYSLELSGFLIMPATIWLANAAFSPSTATQYSVAATIAMQVTILEALAALAVAPPAARLWAAGKKQDVVRLLSNVATVNTAVTVCIVIGLVVAGAFALETAYGASMRDANILLVILAASGIVQAALNGNISLLIIGGYVSELSRTALIILVMVLPCAIVAAFLGGPVPLAIVSSCGISLLSIGEWITARKVMESTPHVSWRLIAAAGELLHGPPDSVRVRA